MSATKTRTAPGASTPGEAVATATVAVAWTTPDAVLQDVARVMRLADYRAALGPDCDVALKPYLGRRAHIPGLSTTPWQLAGVVRTLRDDGFAPEQVTVCYDRNGAADMAHSERTHKLRGALADSPRVQTVRLWEEDWVRIRPPGELAAFFRVHPTGVDVPVRLVGQNIIHLPTLRTDPQAIVGGAMANLCGSLLRQRPTWPRAAFQSALVDLLAVQQEVHAGVFTVMDGTVACDARGRGGPRPHVKNVLLAGADPVAVDTVAAKLMGIDPLEVPCIRAADARGLGVGRMADITLVGDDISGVNFRFAAAPAFPPLAAMFGDRAASLSALLAEVGAATAPAVAVARRLYEDFVWFPLVGKQRVSEMMDTAWGRLYGEFV